MKDKDMIQGNLFDLKGKKKWKALRERIVFILTDYHFYFVIILFIIMIAQFTLLSKYY